MRWGNTLVALDDGNSVGSVSRLLYLDPVTVLVWPQDFWQTGLSLEDPVECPQCEGKLTRNRETEFRASLRESPPRDATEV